MRWFILLSVLCAACSKHSPRTPEPDAPVSLTDRSAGQGCKRDADCPGGRCATELHIASASTTLAAAGGYCTRGCDNDTECGEKGER